MTSVRSPRSAVALAVACLAAAFVAAPATSSTRNYLTVEGRVVARSGAPVAGTWIFCMGSRRVSVAVDTAGAYRLEIPGATLEELGRTPLKIRIQARRKDWRFALANGAPELGLEMSVTGDGTRRLRVRSNDSTTVVAVANSVVLDANPRALLEANFVGSPGAPYDTPPVPLTESDEITLAGGVASIPDAGSAPAAPAPAVAPAPVVTNVAPGADSASAPRAAADSAAMAIATPPPAASAAPRKHGGAVRWDAGGSGDRPRVWGSGTTTVKKKPHKSRPAPVTHAHGSIIVTDSSPRDTSAMAMAGDAARALAGSALTTPVAPGGGDPALKPVPGRDAVQGKTAVASPGTSAPAVAADSAGRTCDCTLRGTVEVQSDRPLASRTEVVIGLEDAPGVSANVELFMGSPRAFEIRGAPCGTHRIGLWTRSKQRFVLATAAPTITCADGGTQQLHLVLEPVARWGAP